MIRGLVFDMDGLLLDSERVVQKTWNAAGVQMGFGPLGYRICDTLGLNLNARREYFKRTMGESFPFDEFCEHTRKIFYEYVEQYGLPLKAGVKEMLQFAAENDLKIGLATSSGEEYARKYLEEHGVYGYFHGAVFGDQVTNAKPDPEIYLKACSKIGVAPSEAVAFEDSPNGIRSSYRAGMIPVMIPDLVEPTAEIIKMYSQKFDSLLQAKVWLESYHSGY